MPVRGAPPQVLAGSACRAAAPTEAYWSVMRSRALADQGSSSQSRATQSVSSDANRGATASRSDSTRGVVSEKNGRPVRVWTRPQVPSSMPKRRAATAASRVSTAIAREPMCFSSHTTDCTPIAA